MRGLLERNPAEGRKALEALFDGSVTFTAVSAAGGAKRYRGRR